MKDYRFRGQVWKVGDNIDTDQIYPGQYLPLTDPEEMGKHALEGVPRFEEFSKMVKKGDILVAGKNFGSGSSREHAPLALKYAGIDIVIAESFSRIFYRNAINLGYPILESKDISSFVRQGDELEVNIATGQIKNLSTGQNMEGRPLSGLEKEIMEQGGLLPFLKSENH